MTGMTANGPLTRKLRRVVALCLAGALLIMLAAPDAARAQDASGADGLLDQVHRNAGIACDLCHREKPLKPAPTAVCAGCHANVTESWPEDDLHNPHDSHMTFPDCSSCHHVHKASENQCAGCHNYEFRTK